MQFAFDCISQARFYDRRYTDDLLLGAAVYRRGRFIHFTVRYHVIIRPRGRKIRASSIEVNVNCSIARSLLGLVLRIRVGE